MHFFPMRLVFALLLSVLALSTFSSCSPTAFDQTRREADQARAADRLSDAERLYREGVRLQPSWKEGWWSLGSLLYDEDRFPEAEIAFKRVIALTPKAGPAYAFAALCEYESGEYDRALQHFRTWARSGWGGTPQLVDVGVFHFALLLTREGKFVEALYMLSTEAAKLGSTPALTEAMGLASLRIAKLPGEYPPPQREMVWLAGEAATHAAQSPPDFAQADEYAKRLLVHHAGQPNVHYFLGTLFTFDNKRSDAAREFREELRVSPQHVPAMLALVAIDLDNNQLPEAESFAERATALEPANAEAHHALGRVLLASGKLDESIHELETAKTLAPHSPPIRSHLAIAYGRTGRTREAQAEANAFSSLTKTEGVLVPPAARTTSQPGRSQ
jgi:tetratricopeptide (TPR) repeat protein